MQDCEELHEWIQEKKVLVKEDSYRSAQTVHSKWTKHQAFASEIEKNQARLDTVSESGEKLLEEKPEMRDEIDPKIRFLKDEFQTLQDETREKGERIIDSNRENLYNQGVDKLDGDIKEIEDEIQLPEDTVDAHDNLVGVEISLKKIEKRISEMHLKSTEINEVKSQAAILKELEPEKAQEYTER